MIEGVFILIIFLSPFFQFFAPFLTSTYPWLFGKFLRNQRDGINYDGGEKNMNTAIVSIMDITPAKMM